MRTFIWLLIACFSLLYACDEELKNKSRDDIGQCVPKGEKAVVISKYTDSPYGELRHFIKSSLMDGSSCVDMVTRFDYKIIQVGDTISKASASEECFKLYGSSCAENNKVRFWIIVLILLFIVVPALLGFVFGTSIRYLFQSTYIGKLWYAFKGFIKNLIELNYGFNIFILTVTVAQLLMGCILWNYGLETNGVVSFQHVMDRLIVLTIIELILVWIFGGIDNLMSNLMILSLTAILVSILILFFGSQGIGYVEMLKVLLKPS